ncbi:hypothetical protein [Streptomyces sp. H34-S4]|uniref:hypothetical protein n=1 Tax=Streptomyces sp. H34-S4 TaxID=2996463 RepID=UPI0022719EC1|nr:hypothetical protein [Streptomyces sp. H34-S4]MCY0938525.1 hypothetical protein [Streptomyces sp. H34-S4]
MDSTLPRRTPGPSGRQRAVPESLPGAPTRALRIRAASGWEKFMRLAEVRDQEATE